MAQPFLGEVKIISWNFPPKGWTFCNGQLLPINQNQALFSILGTTYGGDGSILGELGGETAHTVNISELPAHNHVPVGSTTTPPTSPSAAGNLWSPITSLYNSTANTAMNPACILPTGGSQPHENMSPYLVLNFIIALQGIFPSQN